MRVFVSYARQDGEVVDALASDLAALCGDVWDVWIDARLAGGVSWWDAIVDQIRLCGVFVQVVSRASLRSEACRLEQSWARSTGRPIVPVLVDPDLMIADLPDDLAAVHLVSYRPGTRSGALELGRAMLSVTPAEPSESSSTPPGPPAAVAAPNTISLALSGSGTRGALWALGALLAVIDAGATDRVVGITSVGGASLANGLLLRAVDLHSEPPSGTRQVIADFVLRATRSGFKHRWSLAGVALPPAMRGTKLTELTGRAVEHVFCATEIQSAQPFYLSPDWVYSSLFGLGDVGAITLETAVKSSALVPGAVRTMVLPNRRNEVFQFPSMTAPERVVLVDGSISDPYADSWDVGLSQRRFLHGGDRWRREADLCLRASGWETRSAPFTPASGNRFEAFSRTVGVLTEYARRGRRREVIGDLPEGQRSALVDPGVHLATLLRSLGTDDSESAERSVDFERRWRTAEPDEASPIPGVPASFGAVAPDVAQALIHQSYVQTRAWLWVDQKVGNVPEIEELKATRFQPSRLAQVNA